MNCYLVEISFRLKKGDKLRFRSVKMKNAGVNKKKKKEENYSYILKTKISTSIKNIKFILPVIVEEVWGVEWVLIHFKRDLIQWFMEF